MRDNNINIIIIHNDDDIDITAAAAPRAGRTTRRKTQK